jgi:hypothetical protein
MRGRAIFSIVALDLHILCSGLELQLQLQAPLAEDHADTIHSGFVIEFEHASRDLVNEPWLVFPAVQEEPQDFSARSSAASPAAAPNSSAAADVKPRELPPSNCTACKDYNGPHDCGRLCKSLHRACSNTCLEAWNAIVANGELDRCLARCTENVGEHIKSLEGNQSEAPIVRARDIPFPSKVESVLSPSPPAPPSTWQLWKAVMERQVKENAKIDADFLSVLSYGGSIAINVQSSSSKSIIWQATDFAGFATALLASGMPRIGLVDLSSLQPQGSSQVSGIVAVLWTLDSHPDIWRTLYELAFRNLRKMLPDTVHSIVVHEGSDLEPQKLHDAVQATSLGWFSSPSGTSASLRGGTGQNFRQASISASPGVKPMVEQMVFLHAYDWLVFTVG